MQQWSLIFLVSLLGVVDFVHAQSLSDLYDWGRGQHTLSARSLGMVGQLSAIGGDLANSHYNPAGLCM